MIFSMSYWGYVGLRIALCCRNPIKFSHWSDWKVCVKSKSLSKPLIVTRNGVTSSFPKFPCRSTHAESWLFVLLSCKRLFLKSYALSACVSYLDASE
jgi:hypothetical protein